MIDLHTHVLPGVDDGPATLEESLELCRAAHALGTRTVVATPHVSHDHPAVDAALVGDRCEALRGALAAEGLDLEVVAGAEVAVSRAVGLGDDELAALRLGDGPWLLVEPPFVAPAAAFVGLLEDLQARGHRIVLAHPERIGAFQRDLAVLERLVAGGMVTAITAGSIGGRFGAPVRRTTHELLEAGLAHVVTSDTHGPGPGRPPGLARELEEAGWGEHVQQLCQDAPAAILAGSPVPPAPRLRRPGGRFGRLRGAR